MKLLGLIGGMSWENTIEYYRILNEMIKSKLGGWNSAKIILYSVNFEEILSLQNNNEWHNIANEVRQICITLEEASCSAIVICSNTMHKIADQAQEKTKIPIINVIDETAKVIKERNIETIGLLGTRFTMEGGFYIEKLKDKYNMNPIIPQEPNRKYLHNAIYNEFAKGLFLDETKIKVLDIIENLKKRGAEGIILGCTELPLLIKQVDVNIPLFDTLKIHLKAAVDFSLAN